MMNTPHFLARRIEEHKRSQAQRYLCPICNAGFQHEPRLWAHGRSSHQEALGTDESQGESEVRRKYSKSATEKAFEKSGAEGKARRPPHRNRYLEPIRSQPSPNDNAILRPNLKARPTPLTGPSSLPDREAETKINGIGKLTLAQDPTSGKMDRRELQTRSPPFNPMKRIAAGESELTDSSPDKQFIDRTTGSRRAKVLSGGAVIGHDPDFVREGLISKESNLPRGGLSKRLFNPDTDNPSHVNRRSSKVQEPSIAARRFHDPRTHVFRSMMTPACVKNDFQSKTFSNKIINDEQDYEHFEESPVQPIRLEKNQSAIQGNHDPTPMLQDDYVEPEPEILLQPETRPISHDQLFVEVKGIYAGLLMVEKKCIEVDGKQSQAALERGSSRPTKLSNDQWQALIALHKTLLHEHHDFFLASQHPSANPALSKLPEHYSMPARMWRHGIHSFLEVLRHRLPESLDHMLAFIYIAYPMVALLYETVSSFESTWIECLGDLARYRMAIEDDLRDREVWSGVARFWYSKGADKDPDQGRLYHHLAILARHSSLQQLSLYTKALTCVTPFESARSSIMTLFTPILTGKDSTNLRSIPFETMFIKAHGMLFSRTAIENYSATVSQLVGSLESYIGSVTAKFREQGVFAAISNISALFEYSGGLRQSSAPKSILQLCFKPLRDAEKKLIEKAKARQDAEVEAEKVPNPSGPTSQLFIVAPVDLASLPLEDVRPAGSSFESIASLELESSMEVIAQALKLAFGTFSVCLQQSGDKNVLPLIGVYFLFIWDLTRVEDLHGVRTFIKKQVPWPAMCSFLNMLAKPEAVTSRVRAREFPIPKEQNGRPLPEDFVMRGQWYFPYHRFSGALVDEEERSIEAASMAATRVERILWLGFRLASSDNNECIYYDVNSQHFTTKKPAQHAKSESAVTGRENWASEEESSEKTQASKKEKAAGHDNVMLDMSKLLDASIPTSNDSLLLGKSCTITRSLRGDADTTKSDPNSLRNGQDDSATKNDVMMIDAGVESGQISNYSKKQHRSSDAVPQFKDFFDAKPSSKIRRQKYASDPPKIEKMQKFDRRGSKEPSEYGSQHGSYYGSRFSHSIILA